jgi:Ca2+:H+ antiporter
MISYITSRIFYHNPPGEGHNMLNHPDAPQELKREEDKLAHQEPDVNQWVCLCFLALNVGVMAATAEWVSEPSKLHWATLLIYMVPLVIITACGQH